MFAVYSYRLSTFSLRPFSLRTKCFLQVIHFAVTTITVSNISKLNLIIRNISLMPNYLSLCLWHKINVLEAALIYYLSAMATLDYSDHRKWFWIRKKDTQQGFYFFQRDSMSYTLRKLRVQLIVTAFPLQWVPGSSTILHRSLMESLLLKKQNSKEK